jgi:hypothetical protein
MDIKSSYCKKSYPLNVLNSIGYKHREVYKGIKFINEEKILTRNSNLYHITMFLKIRIGVYMIYIIGKNHKGSLIFLLDNKVNFITLPYWE